MSRLVVWMPRLASWASLALALGVVKAILARPTCQKTGYGCPTGAGVIHCTRWIWVGGPPAPPVPSSMR
jgi:hypothetical protein